MRRAWGLFAELSVVTREGPWRGDVMKALGVIVGAGLLAAPLVGCSPSDEVCPAVEVPPSVTAVSATPESSSARLEVVLEATSSPGAVAAATTASRSSPSAGTSTGTTSST